MTLGFWGVVSRFGSSVAVQFKLPHYQPAESVDLGGGRGLRN
jgi:hypothetical protein